MNMRTTPFLALLAALVMMTAGIAPTGQAVSAAVQAQPGFPTALGLMANGRWY